MSTFHKVFVYGTLKQGEPNHHWFKKSTEAVSNFVCKAETVEKYPLVIATKYNIPFLLANPGSGHNVKGELYEVDDKALEFLDELEDHPNFYVREKSTIRSLEDNKEHSDVWIYFIKKYKPELLNLPLIEDYSSEGPHGLKYMERYLRNPAYDYLSEVILR